MMPAEAYTSPEVLAWERRHLFAGSWTCLGRVDDLFPEGDRPVRQRAVMVGDIPCLVVRDGDDRCGCSPTPAGTAATSCCPTAVRRTGASVVCPYHAWTYDLGGRLIGATGFRDDERFDFAEHGLVELPVRVWEGWVFGHALHPLGSPEVPSFEEHLGALDAVLAPYAPGDARRRRPAHLRGRGELEGDRRELPRVLPLPADPPGAVPGQPADVGGQLRPPGRLGRRLDGPARRHAHDVADRRAGRDAVARCAADDGGVPAPAAQPAGLGAPRLRDDPPDGAARARPDLGGVLLAGAARMPTARCPTRRARWSSGTSPTSRTGRRASRCSAAWPARTSRPGRSRPTRTPSRSWSR